MIDAGQIYLKDVPVVVDVAMVAGTGIASSSPTSPGPCRCVLANRLFGHLVL